MYAIFAQRYFVVIYIKTRSHSINYSRLLWQQRAKEHDTSMLKMRRHNEKRNNLHLRSTLRNQMQFEPHQTSKRQLIG